MKRVKLILEDEDELQYRIDWNYVLRFIAVTIVALIATYACAVQCGWR